MKKTSWNKNIPRTVAEKLKISIGRKEAIKKFGHPRGMLGKKQSKEAIRKIKKWKPTWSQKLKQLENTRIASIKRRKRKIVSCKICGKLFETLKSRKSVYCSYTCLGISKKKEVRKCIDCGRMVSKNNCNRCFECNKKYLIGNKRWNWVGGKSLEKVSHTIEWREWRKSIFERDNYTCQDCGKIGGRLEPHHKKSVYRYPELVFEKNNGITLCKECHKKTDNYGTREFIKIRNKLGQIKKLKTK